MAGIPEDIFLKSKKDSMDVYRVLLEKIDGKRLYRLSNKLLNICNDVLEDILDGWA